MPTQFPMKTNFSAGEWSPLLKGRIDLDAYINAADLLNNIFVVPQGGAQRRGGTKYIANTKTDGKARLVRFEFSVTQAYILEFTNLLVRFYKDEAIIETGGSPVEVVTPYTTADVVNLNFTQSADTLYIVHEDHEPAKLTRTSDIAWTLTDINFLPPPFVPINTTSKTLAAAALTGSGITITASAAEFTAADVGTVWQFSELLAARFFLWRKGLIINIGDYRYFGENLYISTNAATTADDAPVHLKGTESDGAVTWRYVNSGFGYGTCVTFTDTTHIDIDIDVELPFGYTAGHTDWARAQWTSDDGYPKTVAFFEERLWFGGSPAQTQRLWASVSGDFENFTTGELADASLEYTISSDRINAIQWISPGKVLAIGTSGGEFILSASSLEESVTPTNIRIVRESNYGSSAIPPVRPSNTVMFLQRSNRKIREMEYNFEKDAFESPDLSLLAEHMIDSGVLAMAVQQDPQQIIHMINNDGELIAFTYLKEQVVNAWTRQILGGVSDALGADAIVESVSILPAEDAVHDQIWLIVQRWINGGLERHVEVIQPGLLPTDVVEDSFFVDAGVSFISAADDNISSSVYASKSADISSEFTSPMTGVFFEDDGLSMYVCDNNARILEEYTLSIAWDVSSATYATRTLDATSEIAANLVGIFISPDGINLITGNGTTGIFYRYTMSTAWNIGTASYATDSFDVSTECPGPRGIFFKSDGLRMFVVSVTTNQEVHSYTLSAAWDLSSAVYDLDATGEFDLSSEATLPADIHMSADGLRMTILDSTTEDLFQYTLSTAFQLSTASYDTDTFAQAEDTDIRAFFLNELEGKMYIAGSTNDDVFQYTLAQLLTTTVEGLDHLEGETLAVLSDGAVIPDKVVLNGTIRLSAPAAKIHAGLSFLSEINTLDLEAGAATGDVSQGRIKRVSEVVIRLFRTVGIEVGSASDNTLATLLAAF